MANSAGTLRATPPIDAPYSQKINALQLIDRSRKGLDSGEADHVAALLGVTDKEMAAF